MSDKISVIIPIYKAEKYIESCLNSVLSQTYSNIEVILIDDGSPDGCPKICDDYAKKDNRCIVIHKENGGASSARNAGLKAASGKYIVFVDSDDTLPSNAIEKLYKEITESNSQYAAGAIKNGNGKPHPLINKNLDIYEEPLSLLNYLTVSGSYAPYAKIFLTEIIRSDNIYYNEKLKCSEDALFIRQYLKYCKKIRLFSDTVYYVNPWNTQSLSKKFFPEFAGYFTEKIKALSELTETLPLTAEQKNSFIKERAVHGLVISSRHYLLFNEGEKLKEYISYAVSQLSEWLEINAEIENKNIAEWWKKHSNYIENENIDKYINKFSKEEKRRKFIIQMKIKIQKILGKCI